MPLKIGNTEITSAYTINVVKGGVNTKLDKIQMADGTVVWEQIVPPTAATITISTQAGYEASRLVYYTIKNNHSAPVKVVYNHNNGATWITASTSLASNSTVQVSQSISNGGSYPIYVRVSPVGQDTNITSTSIIAQVACISCSVSNDYYSQVLINGYSALNKPNCYYFMLAGNAVPLSLTKRTNQGYNITLDGWGTATGPASITNTNPSIGSATVTATGAGNAVIYVSASATISVQSPKRNASLSTDWSTEGWTYNTSNNQVSLSLYNPNVYAVDFYISLNRSSFYNAINIQGLSAINYVFLNNPPTNYTAEISGYYRYSGSETPTVDCSKRSFSNIAITRSSTNLTLSATSMTLMSGTSRTFTVTPTTGSVSAVSSSSSSIATVYVSGNLPSSNITTVTVASPITTTGQSATITCTWQAGGWKTSWTGLMPLFDESFMLDELINYGDYYYNNVISGMNPVPPANSTVQVDGYFGDVAFDISSMEIVDYYIAEHFYAERRGNSTNLPVRHEIYASTNGYTDIEGWGDGFQFVMNATYFAGWQWYYMIFAPAYITAIYYYES